MLPRRESQAKKSVKLQVLIFDERRRRLQSDSEDACGLCITGRDSLNVDTTLSDRLCHRTAKQLAVLPSLKREIEERGNRRDCTHDLTNGSIVLDRH